MTVLLLMEEKLWLQRSKTLWMKLGDKNTSYFHNKASQHFRRNRILGLKDSAGNFCSMDENVAILLENYYKDLFTSSDLSEIDEVVQHTRKVVTKKMNRELVGSFSRAKLEVALKQMASLKAQDWIACPQFFINTTKAILGMML